MNALPRLGINAVLERLRCCSAPVPPGIGALQLSHAANLLSVELDAAALPEVTDLSGAAAALALHADRMEALQALGHDPESSEVLAALALEVRENEALNGKVATASRIFDEHEAALPTLFDLDLPCSPSSWTATALVHISPLQLLQSISTRPARALFVHYVAPSDRLLVLPSGVWECLVRVEPRLALDSPSRPVVSFPGSRESVEVLQCLARDADRHRLLDEDVLSSWVDAAYSCV